MDCRRDLKHAPQQRGASSGRVGPTMQLSGRKVEETTFVHLARKIAWVARRELSRHCLVLATHATTAATQRAPVIRFALVLSNEPAISPRQGNLGPPSPGGGGVFPLVP